MLRTVAVCVRSTAVVARSPDLATGATVGLNFLAWRGVRRPSVRAVAGSGDRVVGDAGAGLPPAARYGLLVSGGRDRGARRGAGAVRPRGGQAARRDWGSRSSAEGAGIGVPSSNRVRP